MEKFTLKDLIVSFEKGIISKNQFDFKLYEYLTDIYKEAYKNPITSLSLYSSKVSADIDSILKRIKIVSFEAPEEFYRATNNHNEYNEIESTRENAYEVFHCLETKVNLGNISRKSSKRINVSIGLETGTVYVNIISKKKDRMGRDESIVATYALADHKQIVQVVKEGKNVYEYDVKADDILNSVTTTRFDPSHMETYNYSGYKNKEEDNHPNSFDIISYTSQEEKDLFNEYYKDHAPCPHFHYYLKDVTQAVFNNKYSFAINIRELNRYLHDLEDAKTQAINKTNEARVKKTKEAIQEAKDAQNNPILKYDIGMPYLKVASGEIVCDVTDFISKTKEILKKYMSGSDKEQGIIMLYDLEEQTRKNNDIGALAKASDILCYVSSVVNESELNLSGESDSSTDEKDEVVASLGNAFINASNKDIKVKDLLVNRKKSNEDEDDDEPKR